MILVRGLSITSLLCCVSGCASHPGIRLAQDAGGVMVHVETLADYPTPVKEVRVMVAGHRDQVLFSAVPAKDVPQIHKFYLKAGKNAGDLLASHGAYHVLIPQDGSFDLARGARYTVEVCDSACDDASFTL